MPRLTWNDKLVIEKMLKQGYKARLSLGSGEYTTAPYTTRQAWTERSWIASCLMRILV